MSLPRSAEDRDYLNFVDNCDGTTSRLTRSIQGVAETNLHQILIQGWLLDNPGIFLFDNELRNLYDSSGNLLTGS